MLRSSFHRAASARYSFALVATLVLAAVPLAAQEPAPRPNQPRENPFTTEVDLPRLGVISQGGTGTCWSFATTSFLESEHQRIHKKEIDLSEMYFARMAYLEKARRYVMLQGKTQLSEGGLSHDLPALIRLHGAVPEIAYTGLCGESTKHDHKELFELVKAALQVLAKEDWKPSKHWEAAILGIVDAYVGTPPKSVVIDGKTLTPKEYADDVLQLPLHHYVEVMSNGMTPFHQTAELLVPDNWLRYQGYLNVPIDEFMEILDHALRSGYSVAVDADVSEPGFRDGVAKLSSKLEKPGTVTQEIRDSMFRGRETTDDHLMHIVGIAKDKDGGTFYLTKNSWGESAGPFGGNCYLSAAYVRAKALAFMVHKDGMPKKKE
jgi:bleomycin hydrolase